MDAALGQYGCLMWSSSSAAQVSPAKNIVTFRPIAGRYSTTLADFGD
jgi:hypothetical protein